ncbi:hypothetical protein K402DRAFT_383336 [Aulographum hederae CBS 113979]|uniref:Nucleolar protein 16 n=1 Tax=Aulographum hederae CBS 113979 TaxID=1176131 RepID=A0A6G1GR12_9PEZI|nr:hypothetical protein K402DRAFT_383336 [Aulographum hederae CBS 113979]
MGRELQKKKNKSSTMKPKRRKPKSKKVTIDNPIVREHWDKKLTVSQNFRKLGLAQNLNNTAGGSEKFLDGTTASVDKLSTIRRKLATTMEPAQAQIVRDPKTGAIIQIIEPEGNSNPLNDPLNELSDSEMSEFDGFAHIPEQTSQHPVISQLEEAARHGVKQTRKQSEREQEWCQRLVEKHGDNYKAMFMDRKLNPMQQTIGDIRKRIDKWQKEGRAVEV